MIGNLLFLVCQLFKALVYNTIRVYVISSMSVVLLSKQEKMLRTMYTLGVVFIVMINR